MADGSTATALGIQWELFSVARKYADDRRARLHRRSRGGRGVLRRWEAILNGLETDPMSLARQLDWVAKLQTARGLPRPPRLRLERPPHGRARPAVPRPAPGSVALRPAGHRAAGRPGLGGGGRDRPTPADAGLVPGPVPQALAGGGRHRQLGFSGLRPGHGPVTARPYDGSTEGHSRICRGIKWRRVRRRPSCWTD